MANRQPQNMIGTIILGKYRIEGPLGSGNFGTVYQVSHEGKLYAIKQIKKSSLKDHEELINYMKGEIECLRAIKSDNIMALEGIEEDELNHFMICEYCDGGNLLKYQQMLPGRKFPMEKCFEVVAQILKGLQEVHRHGYLHRDLKPENILVKHQDLLEFGQIFKIADFGFSKPVAKGTDTVLGTPPFMAPEIFAKEKYGFGVDMWAIGVIIHLMLTHEFPFNAPKFGQLEYYKRKLPFTFDSTKMMDKKYPALEELFAKIFVLDPNQRMTFHQLKQHKYLKEYFPPVNNDDFKTSSMMYGSQFTGRKFDPMDCVIHILNKGLSKNLETVSEKNEDGLDDQIEQVQYCADMQNYILKMADYFECENKYLPAGIPVALKYNLIKYYIYSAERYVDRFQYRLVPLEMDENLDWERFWGTKTHLSNVQEVIANITRAKDQIQSLYDACMKEIKNIHSGARYFNESLRSQYLKDEKFDDFKRSYRSVTICANKQLAKLDHISETEGKEMPGLMELRVKVLLAHMINHVFDLKQLGDNFEVFFDWLKSRGQHKKEKLFDFDMFEEWIRSESRSNLVTTFKKIEQKYFS